MSLIRGVCQWCGEPYEVGVVGDMLLGGHDCEVRKDCSEDGCSGRGCFLADDGRFLCHGHVRLAKEIVMTGGARKDAP